MVIFDVFIKRKPNLDPLREGLETLDVFEAFHSTPDFNHSTNINAEFLDRYIFMNCEVWTVLKEFLEHFIWEI